MAKQFSILSWNVEHFKKDQNSNARCNRVVSEIQSVSPDVFAIYEVEGKEVYTDLVSKLPNYTFHITEGPQVQEILIGVSNQHTAFFTQKLTYKSGVSTLRPGALVTIMVNSNTYPILFLHTKSHQDPRSFGLRDDIIYRSLKFINVLNRASDNQKANYIIVGDLNTMGLNIPYSNKDISSEEEIERIRKRASGRYGLTLLSKTSDLTWSGGSGSSYDDSNLDHILAAKHLTFNNFGSSIDPKYVDVKGWVNQTTTAKKDKWIDDFSDHCYLYAEIHD
jgi:endonuclease/exonuclease/phosphatase family metal-dependent hydrolase